MEEKIIKRKLGIIPKIFIVITLIIISLFLWMHFIEPKLIVVKDYAITNNKLPKSFDGFTVVLFSDIHFGRTTNEVEVTNLVNKINECKADIVLFAGDLFDPYINLSDNNIEFLKTTLSKINANLKKYAILGDNDYLDENNFQAIMKEANFHILDGKNEAIYYKGNTPIYISGISSITKNQPDYTLAFKKDVETLQLFLAHEPQVILDVENNSDIVFTGHTLGGLVRIPFYGGLRKTNNSLSYEKGKYLINNTTMFVTNGIGTEDISLRFLNIPSFYCLRFFAPQK